MEERLLGTLFRWRPDGQVTEVPLDIFKDDEIYIGRDGNCQCQILDSHVSSRHVHIYTVLFDEDDPDDVEPLVYGQNLSRYGTKWNAYMVHEQGESFLLSDGDFLELTPGISFRFESVNRMPQDPFSLQQSREMRLFSEELIISPRCLGFGAYGRVHMAYSVGDGKQLACKLIDMTSPKKQAPVDRRDEGLPEFGESKQLVALRQNVGVVAAPNPKIEACEREAKILAGLKHPNVVTLEAAIRCDHTLYIFVELATGGDLYSFIKLKGGTVEPTTAAGIILQLLLAVQYIHARNIVHRDIKPDNILTTHHQDGARVILTDFGCARSIQEPTKRLSTLVGTKEYCAPEIFSLRKEGYTAAVDIWSVGQVTGSMLIGYSLRLDHDDHEDEASRTQFLISALVSAGSQGGPADFVEQLLNPQPEKRPSATEALSHHWFKNLPGKHELEQRYQQSIRTWKSRPRNYFGTEPITILTTANSFHTYCPNRQVQTTSTPTAEEYTLFSTDDHVSESSYGDAPSSRPQLLQSPTPITNMYWDLNAGTKNATASHPRPRGQNLMNQTYIEVHTSLPDTQQRNPQFLSQVERLHGDPQLPKGKYLYIAPAELTPDAPTPAIEKHLHRGNPVYGTPNPRAAPVGLFKSKTGATFRPQVPSMNPFIHSPTEQPLTRPDTLDLQGDVYEEERNPVTGRRRRFIYSRPEEDLN